MTTTPIERGLRPPAPSSVSPEAKYYLTLIQDVAPLLYPEAADEAAWDKWIALQENALHTKFTAALPPDDHYRHARSIVAGVPVHVVTPASVPNGDETPLFLQLHGGAMVMGGGDLAWMESATLASRRPGVTWVPDYRMLPRHPYPAALDDAIAVYRAALKTRAPQRIVVVGASAGGNLAAALLMRARDEGLPLPAALVLQTPEVDLTESGDTFRTNVGIDILGSLMPLNMLYAGGHQLTHPYLSPLFGDLAGLPPTFLQSGTRDLFLSNTVRMHRRLLAFGVEAELHIFEGMPHAGFTGNAPEDLELIAEVRRFEDRHLGPSVA
ncbi:alpha/beta hydrolase [Rhodococcus koreensis]|uniref:Acetyl esterase/lipase n=1 Tax=Rhodococcus koreensis TaxID=99653 RepID=A0A1H4L1W2_9NOCA|nr:alpha/beta hydrolase [Rhodococcus koreensis]SEB64721.1 Acetyl esterase/lipase [Rhodococcus koreensis]